jgi:hypothetical protein
MGSGISCEKNNTGVDPVAKSTLTPCQNARPSIASGEGPSESLQKIAIYSKLNSIHPNAFEKKDPNPLNIPLISSLLLNPDYHLSHLNEHSSIADSINEQNSINRTVSAMKFGN